MKTLTILSTMILLTLNGFSQHFFVRASFGGAIGVSSTSSYITLLNLPSGAHNATTDRFPVAFGNGMNFSGAVGSLFTRYFGAELAINYFMGFPLTGKNILQLSGSTDNETIKVYGRMLQLVPAFIITPGLEKFNPYMKLGAIFGIKPVFYQESARETMSSTGIKTNTNSKREFSGGIAIGFTASAGCEYNLDKLITLYAEVNFNGIDYNPTKSSLVTYDVNGEDQLGTLPVRQKETNFVNSREYVYMTPDDQPAQAIKQSYPFSNVALNIGVKFRFGK